MTRIEILSFLHSAAVQLKPPQVFSRLNTLLLFETQVTAIVYMFVPQPEHSQSLHNNANPSYKQLRFEISAVCLDHRRIVI